MPCAVLLGFSDAPPVDYLEVLVAFGCGYLSNCVLGLQLLKTQTRPPADHTTTSSSHWCCYCVLCLCQILILTDLYQRDVHVPHLYPSIHLSS